MIPHPRIPSLRWLAVTVLGILTTTAIISADQNAPPPGGTLKAPDGFETSGGGNSSISLRWKSSGGNVAAYEIQRKAPGGDFVSLPLEPATMASTVDLRCPAGEIFTYRIRSIDRDGKASAWSNEIRGSSSEKTLANPASLGGTTETDPMTVTTSYVGTISGGHEGSPYLQWAIEQMYVAADGTVYATADWDESGQTHTIYREGTVVGLCQDRGSDTGSGIAGDNQYIYMAAVRVESGTRQYGLGRCDLKGKRAPGSLGDSFIPLTTTGKSLVGVAVAGDEVFVADKSANRIRVFKKDFSNATELRSWTEHDAGPMTADTDGNLWMLRRNAGTVVCLSAINGAVLKQVTDVVRPRGLSIDNSGRLLVAEGGPDQQIRVYNIEGAPTLEDTFGVLGGVFSGTGAQIGRVGPGRLCKPHAVGTDAQGNFYIATTESTLTSYTPEAQVRWQLNGLPALDMIVFDPGEETSVYGLHERYVMDYDKLAGDETSYTAVTQHPFKYPDDPRLNITSPIPHAQTMRRLDGQKFLFVSGQGGAPLSVYRFDPETDGEIAIPCGMFAAAWTRKWPANQPDGEGQWRWQDDDADGHIDNNEYHDSLSTYEEGMFQVDSHGNVWQVNWGGVKTQPAVYIRKYPFQGVAANGVPIWGAVQTYPVPAPITTLTNLQYDPEADAMFLFGYTAQYPNDSGRTLFSGRVVCRYDNWSGSPSLTWQTVLPDWLNPLDNRVNSINLAGEYLFCAYLRTNMVKVFRLTDGSHVGNLVIGGQGQQHAWVDSYMGVQAFKRANGEYLIAVERGYFGNAVIFQRWIPGTNGPPQPLDIIAQSEGTRVCKVTWSDVDGETGYRLEKRTHGPQGWGPWTVVPVTFPANVTTYYDFDRTPGSLAAYRVRAEASGVLSDYSKSAYLTTHSSEPQLVGRWRFDNSLEDSKGNHDATFSGGTPVYAAGYTSPGLDFDGINDAVIIPIVDDPVDYSVAMWIKLDTVRKTNLWCRSLVHGPAHSASNWLTVTENGVLEYYMEGYRLTGTTVLQPGVWYHVVISAKNQGHMRIYLNGVREGPDYHYTAVMWTEGDRYYLGGQGASNHPPPDGIIDDLRIYDRSMTALEAQSLYVNTRNLVGRWTFDDTLKDDAGTADATFHNGTPVYEEGIVGKAVALDGVDDLIKMARASTPTQYTLSFWTNLRTLRKTNFMGRTCHQGLAHCASTWAYLDSTGRFCHFEKVNQPGGVIAEENRWYHIALTGSPTGVLRLYVDGVERAAPLSVGTYWPDGVGYQIGGPGCFDTLVPDGRIEDARVYDRELTAQEVGILRDSRWE
jgi:hypothetical protein